MRPKIIYLKTAFKILPSDDEELSMHLLAEVGNEGVSFLFYTREPHRAEGLLAYQFDANISPRQLSEELSEIVENEPSLRQSFSSVNIIYNIREATLVPRTYHNPMVKEETLSLLFGNQKEASLFDEHVRGKDIVNVYRVSKILVDTLRELFPFSVSYHSNTLLIPKLTENDNQLNCTVYQEFIKVILSKNGTIQLAQYLNYSTTTDVVYHLLNVCAQHEIPADSVSLSLSGMIDEKSALYKDLYNYFLQINFSSLPEGISSADGFDEHPQHFFQHLILLSACV